MNRRCIAAALMVWTVTAVAHGGTLAKSMSALPSEVTASIQEKRQACEPAHEEIKSGSSPGKMLTVTTSTTTSSTTESLFAAWINLFSAEQRAV